MKRVFTGVVIALLVVIAFLIREVNLYLFDICIGVITVFASLEVAKLLQGAKRKNLLIPSLLFPSLAYILMLLGINWNWGIDKLLFAECILLVAFFVVLLTIECCLWNKNTVEKKLDKFEGGTFAYNLKICMDTLFGLIYPTLFLLCFVLLNHIDGFTGLSKVAVFDEKLGFVVLLFAVITTILSDVCALYVGMLFKGRKLAPSISPNKTISGCIGGFIGATLISVALYLIVCADPSVANGFENAGFTIWVAIIYGILASLFTQIGDLLESKLKRLANVKDSGNILPGHGGFMDRLDGACMNATFTIIFFALLLI